MTDSWFRMLFSPPNAPRELRTRGIPAEKLCGVLGPRSRGGLRPATGDGWVCLLEGRRFSASSGVHSRDPLQKAVLRQSQKQPSRAPYDATGNPQATPPQGHHPLSDLQPQSPVAIEHQEIPGQDLHRQVRGVRPEARGGDIVDMKVVLDLA